MPKLTVLAGSCVPWHNGERSTCSQGTIETTRHTCHRNGAKRARASSPAPLCPSRHVMSPGSKRRSRPATATLLPNSFLKPAITTPRFSPPLSLSGSKSAGSPSTPTPSLRPVSSTRTPPESPSASLSSVLLRGAQRRLLAGESRLQRLDAHLRMARGMDVRSLRGSRDVPCSGGTT